MIYVIGASLASFNETWWLRITCTDNGVGPGLTRPTCDPALCLHKMNDIISTCRPTRDAVMTRSLIARPWSINSRRFRQATERITKGIHITLPERWHFRPADSVRCRGQLKKRKCHVNPCGWPAREMHRYARDIFFIKKTVFEIGEEEGLDIFVWLDGIFFLCVFFDLFFFLMDKGYLVQHTLVRWCMIGIYQYKAVWEY